MTDHYQRGQIITHNTHQISQAAFLGGMSDVDFYRWLDAHDARVRQDERELLEGVENT